MNFYNKTIVSALALFVLVICVSVTAKNVTYGALKRGDKLLGTEHIFKPKIFLTKQTVAVRYPPPGVRQTHILSFINVTDYGGSKNYGYAKLVKNGNGYRNATIFLNSQYGSSLNFTVQFYGYLALNNSRSLV